MVYRCPAGIFRSIPKERESKTRCNHNQCDHSVSGSRLYSTKALCLTPEKGLFLFQLVWMSVLLKYEYTSLLTFIWTMISEHDRPKESYTSWFVRGEFQRSHHCERSTTIFRPTRLWSPCVIHRQWRTSGTCWSKPSSTNRWRLGGWNTSCRTCPTTHPHCWAAHGCNLCLFTCRCTRQPNGGCS